MSSNSTPDFLVPPPSFNFDLWNTYYGRKAEAGDMPEDVRAGHGLVFTDKLIRCYVEPINLINTSTYQRTIKDWQREEIVARSALLNSPLEFFIGFHVLDVYLYTDYIEIIDQSYETIRLHFENDGCSFLMMGRDEIRKRWSNNKISKVEGEKITLETGETFAIAPRYQDHNKLKLYPHIEAKALRNLALHLNIIPPSLN